MKWGVITTFPTGQVVNIWPVTYGLAGQIDGFINFEQFMIAGQGKGLAGPGFITDGIIV